MSFSAKCPNCGGEVVWNLGDSLVVVCSYCRFAVARTDRSVSSLGQVADLVDTGSLLRLELRGAYKGVAFSLVGHSQLAHQAGGHWDEWYAAFADGRWGWLAEAQGKLYLTFKGHAPALPLESQLVVGRNAFDDFVVAEKGEATAVSAEGELPFGFVPGEQWTFYDLSGPSGIFGTLDYSETTPLFFVGREVSADELGFPSDAKRTKGAATHVRAVQMSCPQCGGPLAMRAPDQALRVTCPSCNGLLDVSQGKLSYLTALSPPDVVPILVPGKQGNLFGKHYTTLGFLRRCVTVGSARYLWSEYLLHNPELGFRWLVEANGHWSFVEPLAPGDVTADSGNRIPFRGVTYAVFQAGTAEVTAVYGEFYWKVAAGERVTSTDYIAPPNMLSCEQTDAELTWSFGTYVPAAEIGRAFGIPEMKPATGVGPIQLFPRNDVIRLWRRVVLLALALWIVVVVTRSHHEVFNHSYDLDVVAAPATLPVPVQPTADSAQSATQVFFSDPFTLAGRQDISVELGTDLTNSWLSVDGDLINESTGEVQTFNAPIEFYTGSDSDGPWSEGSRLASITLPAMRAGSYTLRLETQWDKAVPNHRLSVQLQQGDWSGLHLFLLLLAVTLYPLWCLLRRAAFETGRWEDADFTPSGTPVTPGSDDDSDDDSDDSTEEESS